MNVQVTEWYVPGCPECIPIIENLARSAVRDADVTRFAISAGHRHCHAVPESPRRLAPGAGAPIAAAVAAVAAAGIGELFPHINGPDAPLPTATPGVPNGIDPNL